MLLRGMRLGVDLRIFAEQVTVLAVFRHVFEIGDVVLDLRLSMSVLVSSRSLGLPSWSNVFIMQRLRRRCLLVALIPAPHHDIDRSTVSDLHWVVFHRLLEPVWRKFWLFTAASLAPWWSELHLDGFARLLVIVGLRVRVCIVLLRMAERDLGLSLVNMTVSFALVVALDFSLARRA